RFVTALGSEFLDGLRLLALDDLEVFTREVGDEAALAVGDGEQKADARHVDRDDGKLVGPCRLLLDREFGRRCGLLRLSPGGKTERTRGAEEGPAVHID